MGLVERKGPRMCKARRQSPGRRQTVTRTRASEAHVCGAAKNSGIRTLGEPATVGAKSPEGVGDRRGKAAPACQLGACQGRWQSWGQCPLHVPAAFCPLGFHVSATDSSSRTRPVHGPVTKLKAKQLHVRPGWTRAVGPGTASCLHCPRIVSRHPRPMRPSPRRAIPVLPPVLSCNPPSSCGL